MPAQGPKRRAFRAWCACFPSLSFKDLFIVLLEVEAYTRIRTRSRKAEFSLILDDTRTSTVAKNHRGVEAAFVLSWG